MFRIHYAGIDREKRRFRLTAESPKPPLVTVEPVQDATADPGPVTEPRLVRIAPGTLDLSVPPTQLLPGEVLAAVPFVGDIAGAEPLTSPMADNRPYMLVVEIPVIDQRGHACSLAL